MISLDAFIIFITSERQILEQHLKMCHDQLSYTFPNLVVTIFLSWQYDKTYLNGEFKQHFHRCGWLLHIRDTQSQVFLSVFRDTVSEIIPNEGGFYFQ